MPILKSYSISSCIIISFFDNSKLLGFVAFCNFVGPARDAINFSQICISLQDMLQLICVEFYNEYAVGWVATNLRRVRCF